MTTDDDDNPMSTQQFNPDAFRVAVQFGRRKELGRVSSPVVNENSGLADSRVHPGVLYGHNDMGGANQVYAMDPLTGEVKATLTIAGIDNYDWGDLCVWVPVDRGRVDGVCISETSGTGHHGDGPRNVIYKVREPDVLKNATLQVVDTLKFTWDEPNAASLMIDPSGYLYIISKVYDGDALFARLPASGWGASTPVPIPSHNTARMGLITHHSDPRGADLSPNGRLLLVKTDQAVLFYYFSRNTNYVSEIAGMRPTDVTTYVRGEGGLAVAWNVRGSGFYTLSKGDNLVFDSYSVSDTGDSVVG